MEVSHPWLGAPGALFTHGQGPWGEETRPRRGEAEIAIRIAATPSGETVGTGMRLAATLIVKTGIAPQ